MGKAYIIFSRFNVVLSGRVWTMQTSRDKIEIKKQVSKKESLERLENQYHQAQTSGDSALAKKIKIIIERLKAK